MFRLIENVLNRQQLGELGTIAKCANFVEGRISNPHSKVKNNLQINDQAAQQKSAQIMADALLTNEDFINFAMPAEFAPPLLARYDPDMNYGLHPDAAIMPLGQASIRADMSCTLFLEDPDAYEGGALRIVLGTETLRIKGPAGSAIVYPSHTLHEVEKVVKGQRLVGLTFIRSQVQDSQKRELLYELGEVAALEGLKMTDENYTRIRAVQYNLQRMWISP